MKLPQCPKVYYRIIPQEKVDWEHVKILENNRTIYVRTLQDLAKNTKKAPKYWTFETDGVFYSDSQAEIYNSITSNVLHNVISGQNAVILAFGQTGTGKSSTLHGLDFNFEHRGVLPRAISDLLKLRSSVPKHLKTCICVSFVEISRNHVHDLLKPYPNTVGALKEILKIKVKSEDEALELAFLGEGRREEIANDNLYVSHANSSIFTMHFYAKDNSFQPAHYTESKLHIIDLAGVDTVGKFSCIFKDPMDVGSANLAKSQLEQFFLILSKNVPYCAKVNQNLNAMLQYLGESLNNSTILRFVGHIRINREDLVITLSMLRFGQVVSRLAPKQQEMPSGSSESAEEEPSTSTKSIEKALIQQNLSRGLNDERIKHIERTLNEFLQNKISKITLLNVCDPATALEVMKAMCKTAESASIPPKTLSSNSRTSSSNLLRRKSSEKKSQKSFTSVGSTKTSSIKKGSTTSLLRKGSANSKRKSSSGASVYNEKGVNKSKSLLIPELIPEFRDAWSGYVLEKEINYNEFVNMYRINEELARNVYRDYLEHMKALKGVEEQVEGAKENVILAKFTREFQPNSEYSSKIELCTAKNLTKLEQILVEHQEKVLELQTEMKMYISRSKEIKKELKEHFEEYCKEKFTVPVENLTHNEEDEFMEIEKVLAAEERKPEVVETSAENTEIERFEEYKKLTLQTRKETRAVKEQKKREWVGLI